MEGLDPKLYYPSQVWNPSVWWAAVPCRIFEASQGRRRDGVGLEFRIFRLGMVQFRYYADSRILSP